MQSMIEPLPKAVSTFENDNYAKNNRHAKKYFCLIRTKGFFVEHLILFLSSTNLTGIALQA